MVVPSSSHVNSLAGWSPRLFLGAGAALVVYALFYGLEVATNLAYPGVQDVLLPVGYIVGVVALLGLYPSFVDRTPALARTAAVLAAVSITGWVVLLVSSLGGVFGGVPVASDLLPGVFFAVHPVAMILAYGLFGAAALRTDVHSRTVGFLLFVPPLLLVALLVGPVLGPEEFPFGAFVISSGQAAAHLALGSDLQALSADEGADRSRDEDREVVAHD